MATELVRTPRPVEPTKGKVGQDQGQRARDEKEEHLDAHRVTAPSDWAEGNEDPGGWRGVHHSRSPGACLITWMPSRRPRRGRPLGTRYFFFFVSTERALLPQCARGRNFGYIWGPSCSGGGGGGLGGSEDANYPQPTQPPGSSSSLGSLAADLSSESATPNLRRIDC